MRFTKREEELSRLLKNIKLSPSHDIDHSTRVAYYAQLLSALHSGNKDIVVPASLIHDLGRLHKDLKGKNSAKKGAELAAPLLAKAGYLAKEIKLICLAISQHDQPKLHSNSIESQILKDADYMDGFGARGILRIIMHTAETGGNIKDAIERLKIKAKKRLEGLEFIETRRIAWKLHRLTEMFLLELEITQDLSKASYSGKFIIFEGISGSGKSTQAKLLASYLNSKGIKTKLVYHPSQLMKKLWREFRKRSNNPMSEMHLILAERIRSVNSEIMPALTKGQTVISVRSSLSAAAYQYVDRPTAYLSRYLFNFEPVADALVYLNIKPTIALDRVRRLEASNKEKQSFFGRLQEKEEKRFRTILQQYPNVFTVNGDQGMQDVHREIIAKIGGLIQ